jgi:hypothetical protein
LGDPVRCRDGGRRTHFGARAFFGRRSQR